jgi:hypothetical protein
LLRCVAVAGDPAFANAVDYAKAHPDAVTVGAHGAPGVMTDIPDGATVSMLDKGKTGPLIMQSCDAGAQGPNGTMSNVAEVADSGGISRSNAYGCTGSSATASASALYCSGGWVDGNGQPAPAAVRTKYGLHNCNITKEDSSGKWLEGTCD